MGLVQSAQNVATGTGVLSLTVTLGNPTTAGNGLVVMVTNTGVTTDGHVSGITLGGAAGNFAQAASIGTSADASITECWLDLNCAGGQTAVAITTTGGAGASVLYAAVYERNDLLTAGAFDKTSGNASTVSWTSGATASISQAAEVFVGAVFISGNSQPTITGPSSPWANLTVQTGAQGSFQTAWLSGWEAVASIQTATYTGTSTNGTDGTALVVTLKAVTLTSGPPVLPDLPFLPVYMVSNSGWRGAGHSR